jgi:CHAT domain-containing protein
MRDPKYIFTLLLLFCFQIAFTQDEAADYIIDTSGVKIYGKIIKVNVSSAAIQVKFKSEDGEERFYTPMEIKEWGSDQKIYQSKIYQLTKKKSIMVFMHLISPPGGVVGLFEFQNTLGEQAFMETFMERDAVLTRVRYGRFKKQMKGYFKDEPEIVELLKRKGVRKNDLLALVEEYNDLLEEYNGLVEELIEDVFVRTEDKDVDKAKKIIWNLDDMLLNPEDAAKKYLKALEEEIKDIADENIKSIELNSRVGASFFLQKQYEAAIPYLEKAKKTIQSSNLSKEKEPRIKSMLSTIYLNQRKYSLAVKLNSEALSAWKNVIKEEEDLMHAHGAYLNQGTILKNIIYSKNSITWYQQSASKDHQDWEAVFKRRALDKVVHATKPSKSVNYNLALLSYYKAKDLVYKLPRGLRRQHHIKTQLAIAALFFEAGDYKRSKVHYKNAYDLMKTQSKEHPKLVETSRVLSEIALADQLYTEALAYINQAQYKQIGESIKIDRSLLDNINKIPFPFELLQSITTKGIILFEQNRKTPSEPELRKVLAHYAIATELVHKLRNTHRNEGSDFRLGNITHKLSQHAVLICNTLFELTQKEEYLKEAFNYAELSKSALLFETIHDLHSMEVSGIPKSEMIKENGLKVQIAYLQGEVFYELEQGSYKNEKRLNMLQSKIASITKEHDVLIKNFETNYKKYYDLKYKNKSISLEDLQEQLAPNEVFLEYVVTDSFVYTLAITHKNIKGQLVNLKKPLSQIIKELQFTISKNRPDLFQKRGLALYQAVIGELAPFLEGKKLIIAPDGELHYIPFGVLPTNRSDLQGKDFKIYKKLHYLIEDHPICYNYSASLFILSKKQKRNSTPYKISTWAPNFDSMEEVLRQKGIGDGLLPLPGAQKEATEIANMFNSHAHISGAASEADFKKIAGQYTVLHIATHGILNDKDPLFSSLVMSNKGEEDGILHAFELYNMRLNADLAVLSACNSGMGRLTKGEGVVSIARGFSYAGVPNIIMSKWPVSDWSTEVLMKAFYENIKAGMPKDEALQQAKVKFLEEYRDRPKILAPFFWGGFVLSGNSAAIEALKGDAVNYMLYLGIAGGVLLLLLIFVFFRKRKGAQNSVI